MCVCVFLIVLDAPPSKQFFFYSAPLPLQNPGLGYEDGSCSFGALKVRTIIL